MCNKYFATIFLVMFLCLNFFPSFAQPDGMALIPGGSFTMGKGNVPGSAFSPAHIVHLDSFYIDVHEVTNLEYLEFCKATGNKLPEFWNTPLFRCGEDFPEYPVVGITWADAVKYADWAGKRLPTEAEWEYAARGGLEGMEYPNGNAWTKERAQQQEGGWFNLIEQVGQYEPNGYGLFDMGGNVWEWTSDQYSLEYYAQSPENNPPGPDHGYGRVIRGGSWHSGAMCKRVYYRKSMSSAWVDFAVGFRCVRDIN